MISAPKSISNAPTFIQDVILGFSDSREAQDVPKRARCPHCERLFTREDLDRHIQKCRMKNRETQDRHSVSPTRTIVVDGNNVAYHLAPEGKPLVNNLVLAYRSLTTKGLRPVFVISSALMHAIDKPDALQTFMSRVEIVEARRGIDDDLKIIQVAQDRRADIVSNDRFLDWIDRYPWLSNRLRKYRMTPTGLILS
jgi:hypothetical protein